MEVLEKTRINILKKRKLQFDIERLRRLNENKSNKFLVAEIVEKTKELEDLKF